MDELLRLWSGLGPTFTIGTIGLVGLLALSWALRGLLPYVSRMQAARLERTLRAIRDVSPRTNVDTGTYFLSNHILLSRNPDVRRAAVQSLTRLSPKTPGVERIAFYLDDGDQQVRKYCAVAILKADRNRAPGIEHAASKAAEVLSRLAPECFSSEGDCHECLGLASRSWIQEGIEARKRRVEGAKRRFAASFGFTAEREKLRQQLELYVRDHTGPLLDFDQRFFAIRRLGEIGRESEVELLSQILAGGYIEDRLLTMIDHLCHSIGRMGQTDPDARPVAEELIRRFRAAGSTSYAQTIQNPRIPRF